VTKNIIYNTFDFCNLRVTSIPKGGKIMLSLHAIIDKIDDKKESFISWKKKTIETVKDKSNKFISNEGKAIFIFSVLFAAITKDYFTFALIGCMIYGIILIKRYMNHKAKMDKMKLIDIDYFNFEKTKGVDPIDAFIDDCFNRYLILYRGYKEGQYLTNKDEKQILKYLVEEVSSHLSPLMRGKLALYYGDSLDDLLATKCFIRVSLYAASQKKSLYEETDDKQINKLLKDMMINQ